MENFRNKLARYLDHGDLSQAALASKINCSQATVNRYRNGKRFPDARTALLIDKVTDGGVPFSEWETDFLARSGIPSIQGARA